MQKKAGKIIKRSLLAMLVIVMTLVFIYWELVVYGFRQGKGQLNIIWNARPVEEVMTDPAFPDSLKVKLNLIADVRKFAID